ncbi:hypothetical protein ABW21_db0205649 [Orbilia brochopaga]|nr:hypothetical protein ABW21_db0205649 [Drechslerella brochopaga]
MSKRTTTFPDRSNRPEDRLGFRRNNTNGGNSMIPKALAGQPLKKVNSEPVTTKSKEKLASFAHGNAAPRRDKPLPEASNSKAPGPGTHRVQRSNSTNPAPMDTRQLPPTRKENKRPDHKPPVFDLPVPKIEKLPAKKPSPTDSTVKQQNAAPLGSKEIPSTPQHRFALNDLLSQTNVTPSVKASKEETSPEERVSWAESPKNQRRLKRARSSSPMGTPRPSKRSSKQTAFDISSSALKTPLTNPFEDAWTKRLQEQPSSRVPFVQAEDRFEGGSPRGLTDVFDSPSSLRRSYSAPTKRFKVPDRKLKEVSRLEQKFAESALKPARSGSVSGRNIITNEKVSSLLAKLQENSAKVAVLQKSETAPAALSSSLGTSTGRFDDPSASIRDLMTPPVQEADPWHDLLALRRSNSAKPSSEMKQMDSEAVQQSAVDAHPKSDDYGLDDDDDADMLELGDSTCPDNLQGDTSNETVVAAKDGGNEMDYGLDDLDDDDDNWEADIAQAVGKSSAVTRDKRIFKTPVKPSSIHLSSKRDKSPVPRIPSDDYGSDFDPEDVVVSSHCSSLAF